MLRVTIELIPRGDESRKKHLGTVEISNDGTGDTRRGNYAVRLAKFGRPTHEWMRGVVRGFDRVKKGPYDLLLQCLVATVGGRNQAVLRQLELDCENEPCAQSDI